MIIDIHTHYFRPEPRFGPSLRSDMARCGVDPAVWGDVANRHLESTFEADVHPGELVFADFDGL